MKTCTAKKTSFYSWLGLILASFFIAACGGDNGKGAMYRVTVTNTTHNQPMSPVAVMLHKDEYSGWKIGSAASFGLEDLAESGNPMAFLDENSMAQDAMQGEGVLMPGNTEEIEVKGYYARSLQLTIASMLVNTNDAFVGVTNWDVGHLNVGERMQLLAPVYDAGTEENSETAATVPGPAAGGEGTNSARELHDFVTRHPGVVTKVDGYMASALDESHRFDNGAALIVVERIH